MGKSELFDLFQWVYICLTAMGIMTFICFTSQFTRHYPKHSTRAAKISLGLIIASFLSDITLKAIALAGVEM